MAEQEIDEVEMEKRLTAVTVVALEALTNIELAAANVAVQLRGICSPPNLAFTKLRDMNLIDVAGHPCEPTSLRRALVHEINRRKAAGTFGTPS